MESLNIIENKNRLIKKVCATYPTHTKAAKVLGISVATLSREREKLGLKKHLPIKEENKQ